MDAPAGLGMQIDFLSNDEHQEALGNAEEFSRVMGRKEPYGKDGPSCVAHFGQGFEEHRWVRDIPSWLASLATRIQLVSNSKPFDSVSIFTVPPRKMLPPHDHFPNRFGEPLAILPLGGIVLLQFDMGGDEHHYKIQKNALVSVFGEMRKAKISSKERYVRHHPRHYLFFRVTKPHIATIVTNPE